MTWVKIDDLITEHPKFVSLSPAGWTLWLHGLTFCSRNLTDGHIPAAMLPRLSALTPAQAKKAAAELVAAGAWRDERDGWQVHDYLDHQRSKGQVDAEREAANERQRKAREAKRKRKEAEARQEAVTDASRRDIPVSHGDVTLLEAETESDVTTSSNHGFNRAAPNLLEDDTSELRAQRIARLVGPTDDHTLVAVRDAMRRNPALDDTSIAATCREAQ